jgi:hypothetical protein
MSRAAPFSRSAGAPEFVQVLADDSARGRNHSGALVYNRLGVTGIPSPEARSAPNSSAAFLPQHLPSVLADDQLECYS